MTFGPGEPKRRDSAEVPAVRVLDFERPIPEAVGFEQQPQRVHAYLGCARFGTRSGATDPDLRVAVDSRTCLRALADIGRVGGANGHVSQCETWVGRHPSRPALAR